VTVAVNASVLAGYALLAYVEPIRRRPFFSILRDWYPFPQMLLAYREMGWMARPHEDFALERSWVVWDKLLLNDYGLKALIESTGPVLPSLLEISYSLVYTISTFGVVMLYVYRKRERVDSFLTTFGIGILAAYALFPYFPSEPPRTVFPGEDFPSIVTPFRRFNWGLLGEYGIHTSVFPSAHVSGAFSGAFAMIRLLPEHRWAGRFLVVLAVLIATATVYGRYHYAVDALAGFAIAVAAAWMTRRSY
jgi:membrane-associated phospholipid phosphatase